MSRWVRSRVLVHEGAAFEPHEAVADVAAVAEVAYERQGVLAAQVRQPGGGPGRAGVGRRVAVVGVGVPPPGLGVRQPLVVVPGLVVGDGGWRGGGCGGGSGGDGGGRGDVRGIVAGRGLGCGFGGIGAGLGCGEGPGLRLCVGGGYGYRCGAGRWGDGVVPSLGDGCGENIRVDVVLGAGVGYGLGPDAGGEHELLDDLDEGGGQGFGLGVDPGGGGGGGCGWARVAGSGCGTGAGVGCDLGHGVVPGRTFRWPTVKRIARNHGRRPREAGRMSGTTKGGTAAEVKGFGGPRGWARVRASGRVAGRCRPRRGPPCRARVPRGGER